MREANGPFNLLIFPIEDFSEAYALAIHMFYLIKTLANNT